MQSLFPEILYNSPAGAFIAVDGVLVYINPRFAEIFGYQERELEGKELLGLFPEEYREMFTGRRAFKCRGLRKDGSRVPLEFKVAYPRIDGKEAVAGSVMDLSCEEELAGSEERFRKLIVESPFPALIHSEEGRVLLVSRSWTEMSGYSIEDIPTSYDFNSKALGKKEGLNREHIEEAYRLGRRIDEGEFQIRTKSGETRTWVFSTVPLGNDGGRRVILCMAMDITDRIRAEDERSGIFHMMTHDIKGPLTIISGYGELIQKKEGDKAAAEMAGEIIKAGRRISALIDDMLAISKAEAAGAPLSATPMQVKEVVEEALAEAMPAAEKKGLEITTEVEEGLVVHGDRMHLLRAVSNLVANAIKYNKWGGKVSVRARTLGEMPDHYFIEVSDTGMGIPEDDQPHIFEKFYRSPVSGAVKGTGLGLAVVKAVTEAHGGSVSLKSRPGEGSTFRICMPKKPLSIKMRAAA